MTRRAVSLESIERCLQGLIPAWVATCSADGVPNVAVLSIVHYVDSERVGLSRQFFNKTAANVAANPRARVIVVDPETMDEFELDLQFLHTETEGPTFDRARASLDGIASQTGMADVFRLRGVDMCRVVDCISVREISGAHGDGRQAGSPLRSLDELVRRLALCADYAEATRRGIEALEDLFEFRQSILLVADEPADRLFAVASNGYASSSAGAEAPSGVGVIGVAAERRAVVCVPNIARARRRRWISANHETGCGEARHAAGLSVSAPRLACEPATGWVPATEPRCIVACPKRCSRVARAGRVPGGNRTPSPCTCPRHPLDNVSLVPHVAWLTPETSERSIAIAAETCRVLRDRQELVNRVA